MAEELKGSRWDDYGPPRKKRIRNIRYPWHKWFNGSMWYLREGVDFEKDIREFRTYALGYAKLNGIDLKTKFDENKTGLFIKAGPRTSKNGLRRSRHFRDLKRNFDLAVQEGNYKYDYEEVIDGEQE